MQKKRLKYNKLRRELVMVIKVTQRKCDLFALKSCTVKRSIQK